MKKEGVVDGLREILKKEKELYHRYLSQATSVASPRLKDTLTQIAWEKSAHVATLAEIIIKCGGELVQIPVSQEGVEGRLKETVISSILNQDYEEETRLFHLYQEQIREMEDEELKGVLRVIMEKEARHRDEIRELYRGFS